MEKITRLSLFVLNRSKLRRLILGLSSRQLSFNLKHGESYVSKVEDIDQPNVYPTHEWPNLATELKCNIHDLLPPDEMDQNSDGSTVEKKVLSLTNVDDADMILEGLIEYGFFDSYKSEADVANHLFVEGKEESKVITSKLEEFAKDGRLLKNNDLFIKK